MIDVQRSSQAPASLARETSWGGEDVLVALHRDFLGKCYLCESPVEPADFEVEHRIPRALKGSPSPYDWTNLYPACDRCNGRRPAYPAAGLLDPGEGVEQRIEQRATAVPGHLSLRCGFQAHDESDIQAHNTASELAALHDPTRASTYRARKRTRNLLRAISQHYLTEVHPTVRAVETLRRRQTRGERVSTTDLSHNERRLREKVSRRAPFTMLVRSLVGSGLSDLFD